MLTLRHKQRLHTCLIRCSSPIVGLLVTDPGMAQTTRCITSTRNISICSRERQYDPLRNSLSARHQEAASAANLIGLNVASLPQLRVPNGFERNWIYSENERNRRAEDTWAARTFVPGLQNCTEVCAFHVNAHQTQQAFHEW